MSDRVGKVGRVVPSKGLDVMICLLARFRIGVETRWSVGVDETAGSGTALYKRRSGVSIRWLKGALSFWSARLPVPGKRGVAGSISGGLSITRLLPHTSGVHGVCKKHEDAGVVNW